MKQAYGHYSGATDLAAGLAWYRRAAREHPESAFPHLFLASLLEIGGNVEAARAEADQGRRRLQNPEGCAVAQEIFGTLCLYDGRLDQALTHFRTMEAAVDDNPVRRANSLVDQAYVLFWQGHLSAARATLSKAFSMNTAHVLGLRLQCALDLIAGDAGEAVRTAERMVQAQPDDVSCAIHMKTLLDVGRLPEALEVPSRRTLPVRRAGAIEAVQLKLMRLRPREQGALALAIRTQLKLGPQREHAPLWRAMHRSSVSGPHRAPGLAPEAGSPGGGSASPVMRRQAFP